MTRSTIIGALSWAVWLGVVLGSGSTPQAARAEQPPSFQLRYELKAEPTYQAKQPVSITFTLQNLGDKGVSVLTWYTPLEGLQGDIFVVKRKGKALEYQGPMVKRANPAAEDYVKIPAKGSVSKVVNLAEGYKLTRISEYEVEFAGVLLDVVAEGTPVPRDMDAHQEVKIEGNKVSFRIVKKK